MDIQVSSNFERLLYRSATTGMGRRWSHAMHGRIPPMTGRSTLPGQSRVWQSRPDGAFFRPSASMMRRNPRRSDKGTPRKDGEWQAARPAHRRSVSRRRGPSGRDDPAVPIVALATAHPAKFPAAVEQRERAAAPNCHHRLAEPLRLREERFTVCLPNDAGNSRGLHRVPRAALEPALRAKAGIDCPRRAGNT